MRLQMRAEQPQSAVQPESIALRLVYEDADVLVIDKPAGLVVHPGAGNPGHTLQNALLGLDSSLATLPRAGENTSPSDHLRRKAGLNAGREKPLPGGRVFNNEYKERTYETAGIDKLVHRYDGLTGCL